MVDFYSFFNAIIAAFGSFVSFLVHTPVPGLPVTYGSLMVAILIFGIAFGIFTRS